MKILPIDNSNRSNSFGKNSITTTKSQETTQAVRNANTVKHNGFRKSAFGILTAFVIAALTTFIACKKDDNKPVTTGNKDLVDIAFRDFVDLFNLDTVGFTKVLKLPYFFNGSDSLVTTFDYPTSPDTLYANGIYYYTGPDQFVSRETPFQNMWIKNGNEIISKFKYPWNRAKHGDGMPQPLEIHYIDDIEGDNSMEMIVIPESGGSMINVKVINDSAFYALEDSVRFKRPYRDVKIKENYQILP